MGRDGYEDVCSMCHRSESSAGKMIRINDNMCICRDCLQRSFDMMNNMGSFDDVMKNMRFDIDGIKNEFLRSLSGVPDSLKEKLKDIQTEAAEKTAGVKPESPDDKEKAEADKDTADDAAAKKDSAEKNADKKDDSEE